MGKSKKQPKEFENVEQQELFNIVRHESGEHFIALGDCAVLKCETKEIAQKAIDERDYELLLNLMVVVAKKVLNQQEQQKETKK